MISHRPVRKTNVKVLYNTTTAIEPNTTVSTPSSGVRNRLWRTHAPTPERVVGPRSTGGWMTGSEPSSTIASLIVPSLIGRPHRSTRAIRRLATLTMNDVTSDSEMYTSIVSAYTGTAGDPLPTDVLATRVRS